MEKITVKVELDGIEQFEEGLARAEAALKAFAGVAKQAEEILGMPVGHLAFWRKLRFKVVGWLLK